MYCRMDNTAPDHGTLAKYKNGCMCDACKRAYNEHCDAKRAAKRAKLTPAQREARDAASVRSYDRDRS